MTAGAEKTCTKGTPRSEKCRFQFHKEELKNNRTGAGAWGSHLVFRTYSANRKLSTIQRPFLLAISGAYRITSTAVLQVILDIPPFHLQLPLSTNISDVDPSEIEEKTTAHPLVIDHSTQISQDDGGIINTGLRIYTNGSKTEKEVGAVFCSVFWPTSTLPKNGLPGSLLEIQSSSQKS
ncbi:hypothetical protein AVEN_174731-1 [Araneus ventricosus]|uniref:Uncharacterized protein n=1 Tax=Araneus ventricosus TaxID=182803 RepID=A0A4Y2BKI1_ARAVE|nr:hypothetical protein AVEN_174731-1 [Araneus ventricosus]